MVQHCLEKKNKGKKTGTIAGAAVGGGTALIAGGNLGVTALAAGGGAVAGNLIGKGAGTNKECDAILKRNP
jgi:outer membrane lipoprotein SlyB